MNSDKLIPIFRRNRQWPLVMDVARRVKKANGRVLVVGGAVRDALLGNIQHSTYNIQFRGQGIKDFDLEVYGISKTALKRLLLEVGRSTENPASPFRKGQLTGDKSLLEKGETKRFSVQSGKSHRVELKEIGKQFGVFSLGRLEVAIPRTDSRTRPGLGRKPKVVSQPGLTFEQASRRRDLTINAMAYDPLTGEILDEQGGLDDLRRGLLRVVDADSFGDDPLRVLRVMQFAGRFGFTVDPQTIDICRRIDLKHLAQERVGEEWTKMLLKSPKPSLGLEAGRELWIFRKLHPALTALKPADWRATKLAVDGIAGQKDSSRSPLGKGDFELLRAMLIVLIYRMRPEARQGFLKQINCPHKETRTILGLIEAIESIKSRKLSDESVRRMAYRLSRLDEALTIDRVAGLSAVIVGRVKTKRLTSLAKKFHVFDKSPVNLLSGKDLLALGVRPGKRMGEMLSKVFERQLKGDFDDKRHRPQKRWAMKWVRKHALTSSRFMSS